MNVKVLQKLIQLSFKRIHLPETTNKHFSFCVDKNEIICWGYSKLKTSPQAAKYGYKWLATHSELDCVLKFPMEPAELSKFSLINTRVNSRGLVCNSKPCNVCTKLVEQFNFREVWFTNQEGNFQEL